MFILNTSVRRLQPLHHARYSGLIDHNARHTPPLAPPAPLWLAPPPIAPQQGSPLCSRASQLLWRGPTSRARASSATAPRLPDADRRTRRTSLDNDGQTRVLPGSDTIPLHVMWP